MKKGFTLAEMLAVVTMMAVIALLVIPNVTSMLNNVNSEKYNRFLSDVFLATEAYVEKNISNYENNIKRKISFQVSKNELLNSHYLKSTLHDPKNNKSIKDEDFVVEVYFKNDDNEFHYKLYYDYEGIELDAYNVYYQHETYTNDLKKPLNEVLDDLRSKTR